MRIARPRDDEARSLQALHALDVLDSAPEAQFDALVQAASLVCGTPIALISLIDTDRQWFKANVGLGGVTQTSRDVAFCSHAVLGDALFEVPDAALDPRFADNPLVVDTPGIRYYAGVPLCLGDGSNIGTLCVIDREPRLLTAPQREILTHLAEAAVRGLEARRWALRALDQRSRAQREADGLLDAVRSQFIVSITDTRGTIIEANDAFCAISQYSREELVGANHRLINSGHHPREFFADMWQRIASGVAWRGEICNRSKSGATYWVDSTIVPLFDDHGHIHRYVSIRSDITQRKLLELRVENSERFLRHVLDNVPALIAHIDTDQRYTLVNQAYLDWDHRPGAAVVGHSVAEVHGAQDYAQLKDGLEQALRGQGSAFEVEMQRGNQSRFMQVTYVPDQLASGQVAGVFSMKVDVTELRLAEERLHELIELQPRGLLTTDLEGRCTYTNAAWQRMAGLTLEQSLGYGLRTMVHPDDLASVLAKRQQALEHGGPIESEHRYVRPDGATVWVRAAISRVSQEGLPDSIVAVVEDVTERHHLDEALAERSAELARTNRELELLASEQKALLDNDLIGIVKLRGRMAVWANRGLERLFGYGPSELVNQPSRILYVDDESHRALGESAYPYLHRGERYRAQLQMRRKDGRKIWVDLSGALLSAAKDESMWVMTDITPLKEAELNRLRTVELEAENRQLLETSRLKSMFLTNMSHEMRTPLNAVIGFAGLLEAGAVSPQSPKFKSFLAQITTSGKQLLQLIETVLDFAQAEAGRIEFHPTLVRLPDLLGEVVAILKDEAEHKHVEVITDVDASVAELVIDPMRLKQVISGYLSNAIKFTPGPGQVTIRALPESVESLRIEVEDHGIGIAEADLPKLFSQFQQLSEGNTKAYQGTGMALALARVLVEAQGGSVGVRTKQGSGSVFWLVLPCRRGA